MSQNGSQSELYMGDHTSPVDVLDFVYERLESPAVMRDGDVIVFNFHNRPLYAHALSEWAMEAEAGVYVVPYQVSGVWTFMHGALPQEARDADTLAYRKSDDSYVDYPNWRRTLDRDGVSFDDSRVSDRLDSIRRRLKGVLDDAR